MQAARRADERIQGLGFSKNECRESIIGIEELHSLVDHGGRGLPNLLDV
jgi:hypothetical protein